MKLVNTELVNLSRGETILATVTGFIVLTDREITALENKTRGKPDTTLGQE